MVSLNFPRTTLFILDKDTWINSKAEAEHLGYTSVSEYVFSLLKSDLKRKISLQLLLLELEKYYEFNYYTLELVAERTSLPLRIVIALMNELQLPLPEKKSSSDRKRIHDELIKNKLLPREVQTILSLKNEFAKKEDVLEDADMLTALFPDEEERTLEVLTETRQILLEILEKSDNDFSEISKKANFYSSDLRKIFYNFALQYDEETIVDDPLYLKLKEHKA